MKSIAWWLGLASVVLTALANEVGMFPPEYHKFIQLASTIVAVVMTYLKASPLQSRQ